MKIKTKSIWNISLKIIFRIKIKVLLRLTLLYLVILIWRLNFGIKIMMKIKKLMCNISPKLFSGLGARLTLIMFVVWSIVIYQN